MIFLQYRYGVRDSQFLLEQLPSVLRETLWLIGRLFFLYSHGFHTRGYPVKEFEQISSLNEN